MHILSINNATPMKEVVEFIDKNTRSKTKISCENVDTFDYKERSGNIIIDYSYQRKFVLTNKEASRYVESVFLGVVIPEIHVFEDINTGIREIVDGQQRSLSLLKFFRNEYYLEGLDVLPELNGFYFKDLPAELQSIFKNFQINIRILSKEDAVYKYILFEKLNTGSKKLSPQEIRNCLYRGYCLTLIKETSTTPMVSELFMSVKNDRFKRDEVLCSIASLIDGIQKNKLKNLPSSLSARINLFLNESKEFSQEYTEQLLSVCTDLMEYLSFTLGTTNFHNLIKSANKNSLQTLPSVTEALFIDLLWIGLERCNTINSTDILNGIRHTLDDMRFKETFNSGTRVLSRILLRASIMQEHLEKQIAEQLSLELDDKRFFSDSDKREIYLRQISEDNRLICTLCNQEIYDVSLAEADHIVPWSLGGKTVPNNGQLVHSNCNRQKSNKYIHNQTFV